MSTSWSDTFAGRTIASNTSGSWGTASDGETWTVLSGGGSPATWAVTSGEGLINTAGTGQVCFQRLGSVTSATDMEVSCRISPGNAGDTIYVFARLTDSTHYYRLASQGNNIGIGMKNGGSFSTLASVGQGFTTTAGTFYWLRFRIIGTSIYGKTWIDGNSEPTTWTVTATDASVASGGVGCGCNPQTSSNNQFDTFNAFTIDVAMNDSGASLTDSLSLTGVKNITDSLSLVESATSTVAQTYTDSVSLTDSATYPVTYNGTDNIDGYRATILGDSPIAYYRLGQSSGTIATDSSPNARNGTISATGITYSQPGAIQGDTNTCLQFDGSTSQITLPQAGLPTGAQNWSVECWCMRPTLPSSGGYNFAAAFGTYSSHELAAIGIHWGSATVGHTILSTYSGDIESAFNVNPGQWYHVVGTSDGTNINLYTNGTLSNHTAEVPNIVLSFANIGAGSGDRFTGFIDEVAIYNYALTPTQILAHYNAGTTFQNETIVETSATTLTDAGNTVDTASNTTNTTMTDSGASITDTSANTPIANLTDQINNTQNLTLWYLSSTTTTLPTATGLSNLTGGSLGSAAFTTIGTGTGFGQIHAQTYAGAWPALSTLGPPDGNGYLFDSTLMEGMTLLARTQSPAVYLNCSPGTETIIADLYLRLCKYNANTGTYGIIAVGLSSGATIHAGGGFGVPTTWPVTYFGPSEKIYIDIWANVTSNTNADATLKIEVQGRSSSSLGVSGQNAYSQLQYQVGIGQLTETVVESLTDIENFSDTQALTIKESPIGAQSLTDTANHTEVYSTIDTLDRYRATVRKDLPVAYYQMEETSGTTLIDNSGNGYNGTINATGVTLAQPGVINTSQTFDGIHGHDTLPASLNTAGWIQISVEFWINFAAIPTTTNPRIIANDFTQSNNNGFEFLAYSTFSGMSLHIGNGTTQAAAQNSYAFPVGSWVHVVGTWDGSQILLYVNGSLNGSSPWTGGPIGTSTHPIAIGYQPAYGGDYVNGSIDEVSIYNYALTSTQIAAHYSAGISQNETVALTEVATHTNTPLSPTDTLALIETTTLTNTPLSPTDLLSLTEAFSQIDYVIVDGLYRNTVLNDAPLAYYRLDETVGTTAIDTSSHGRNGTLHGSITLAQPSAIYGSTGTSMLFNGSGYITLPQSGLPTGTQPWSIEAWVYLASLPTGGYYTIVGFGTYSPHEMADIQVHGISSTTANITLSTYSGDINTGAISANTWYHVVGTYDGTTTRLYVNGSLSTSGTFTLNVTLAYASIGAGSTGPTDFMHGTIDEVAIYNYALSPTQILIHYNAAIANTFTDVYSLAEAFSGIDLATFSDKIVIADLVRTILVATTTRNGIITTTCR